MNITTVKDFLSIKRAGIAWLIFLVGLLALPAAFTAGGIYHRAGSPIS
jgi:hypothetical protein